MGTKCSFVHHIEVACLPFAQSVHLKPYIQFRILSCWHGWIFPAGREPLGSYFFQLGIQCLLVPSLDHFPPMANCFMPTRCTVSFFLKYSCSFQYVRLLHFDQLQRTPLDTCFIERLFPCETSLIQDLHYRQLWQNKYVPSFGWKHRLVMKTTHTDVLLGKQKDPTLFQTYIPLLYCIMLLKCVYLHT